MDGGSLEGTLRETSDTLLAALEELTRLEQRKRGLQPGDASIVEVSTRIEEIAEQVLGAALRDARRRPTN